MNDEKPRTSLVERCGAFACIRYVYGRQGAISP